MYKAAVLVMSDKGSQGLRTDSSGKFLNQTLSDAGYSVSNYQVISDDSSEIRQALIELSADCDLILTSGGTGLSPRDNTPQTTAEVIDYLVPGISETIRSQSLCHTPRAMLSRGLAGVRGGCLIINFPGSEKACRESWEIISPILEHALETLKGRTAECARL